MRCFTHTDVIRATCADYRAGATVDVEHDEGDRRDQVTIQCPVFVATSVGRGDVSDVWRRWADDVTGVALPCGYFLAEEAPAALLDHLDAFLPHPAR